METTKILIVEDESIVALDIKRRLENFGYSVVDTVMSGEKAVDLAGKLSPDLILMDIQLKGKMDGIEAAALIRNQYHLPVIFLTAFDDEETLQRARISQPYGFILKPFEDHSLTPAIEMALYKHKMEQALRDSETRYRILVETMPDALLVTDLDFKILFCNQQAVLMLGYGSLEDLLGKNGLELFAPDQRAHVAQDARHLLEANTCGIAEYTMMQKDGVCFPGEIKGSLQRDGSDAPNGFIVVSRDISERKALENQAQELMEQIQSLARRDSLTQLYNHRYFYEIAETEFARAERYQHPLAVIMVDLDFFKQVNDSHGHLIGDQVLRMVADEIQSNLRAVDILGRVGGDEFLALLPETSAEEAMMIAGRLSKCIDQNFITFSKQNIQVTASLGVAVNVDPCPDLETLIQRADRALYMAKGSGRDRIELQTK